MRELLIFCALAAAFILLAVYQLYLNQWLQIRWREWMTRRYLQRWLEDANHYRMQLLGDAADNPDQRVAEDIRLFVERTLYIGLGLINAVVTLVSFLTILWVLSASAPFQLFGVTWAIPGYLVWAAFLYALGGTLFAHLIGRPLIDLNFNQQRFEADFRFSLVRVRENSEQIALLDGERAEQDRLMDRFGAVARNWFAIMTRQKKLTFFTAGYNQASVIFPYLVVSPAYFSGVIQLGGLTQTANAFNNVQAALSFFINVYVQFAEWRAVIERLSGFDAMLSLGVAVARTPPVVSVVRREGAPAVKIDDAEVRLPSGVPLVAAADIVLPAGDRILVTGPTGSGKSSLFRAIAGIWPFGRGTITVPAGARLMMLPQRPYFLVGSLEAAVSYPAVAGTFEGARIAAVLVAVGLPALAQRLDEHAHWNRTLSLGEQQRLGIARALLHEPQYLFLDEATASLDEPSEATLYRLIHERLPGATIVSIGHRSTLFAYHRRHLALIMDDGRSRVREVAMPSAAQ
jgi:putative ATP-binding cassette transporter